MKNRLEMSINVLECPYFHAVQCKMPDRIEYICKGVVRDAITTISFVMYREGI